MLLIVSTLFGILTYISISDNPKDILGHIAWAISSLGFFIMAFLDWG